MSSILSKIISVCLATVSLLDPTTLVGPRPQWQQLKLGANDMAQSNLVVPGHNGAIYGPVPEHEQIFKIKSLEIAPTPIIA